MTTAMTTCDDLRVLALQMLRGGLEEAESGGCSDEYHAVPAVYNRSCDEFSTDAQLPGEDDSVSPATDWWILAHQVACGVLVSAHAKPPLPADAALRYAIETLESELSRPKVLA
jgi:hypothetical protein